jgi:hypothetical protein
MKRKLSVLSVIFVFLIGLLMICPLNSDLSMNLVSAETWSQTTTEDFDSGANFFVEIDYGKMELSRGLSCRWTAEGEDQWDNFGYSVASAGDVNGDGYDDVIVGSRRNDDNGTDSGKAYVYHGTINGLEPDPAWTAMGGSNGDYFGGTVSTAGDVNGDGFDDVVIGSSRNSSAGLNAGMIFIYLGSPNGLNEMYVKNISGEAAEDGFGTSVACAGDVDGDGFSDVIVGAPLNDKGGFASGRAYVFYGNTPNSWNKSGEFNLHSYGASVASAGDVNGDGFDDIIIGAPMYRNAANDDVGKVYVHLGSSTGVNDTVIWTQTGEAHQDRLGDCVASAGDLNNDGYDDVVVGAFLNDEGGDRCGKIYVYLGSKMGVNPELWWEAVGEGPDDRFGDSLASAGDVNGDGFDDLIIAAPYNNNAAFDAGKVYFYYGSNLGLGNYATWTQTNDDSLNLFGHSVACAGDVNGDGFSDIIVGASEFDKISGRDEGKAYVYQYFPNRIVDYNETWSYIGEGEYNYTGCDIASAGDVNGDGYEDLLVGSYRYYDYKGKVELFHGSASGLGSIPDWIYYGENYGDYFGYSLSSAGDFNADGFDDVIIGAYGYNSEEGKIYIFFGSNKGLSNSPDFTEDGSFSGGRYGYCVSSAGDVNGDGFSDVVVGTPYQSSLTGRVYLYYGFDTGFISTISGWYDTGESGTTGQFGYSVSSAGDVNGDGCSDILVGAPYYETNDGKVYCYYGSPSGLGETFNWNYTVDSGEEIGECVSSTGDVNGDGYDDIMVGAPHQQKAYLFHGSASGLGDDPAGGGSSLASSEFGNDIAYGDINGDGYSDVVIGAYDYYNVGGKAFLYHGSSNGLITKPSWFETGEEDPDYYGRRVCTADVNGDGADEIFIGATRFNNGSSNDAGKVYMYSSPGYLEYGCYYSEIVSTENIEAGKCLSISWEPITQPESTSVKFQIGTSNDGLNWHFTGPGGLTNSYYSNPNGQQISLLNTGKFWRLKILLFSNEDHSATPTVTGFSVFYKTYELPNVKITSPNGGEDWMKNKYYPITWEATGEFNETPINIFLTWDNGDNWSFVEVLYPNHGVYNWTVPNIETASALIAITVVDIYGNEAGDISDASFAIDPPPPTAGDVSSGGGSGTQFPPDDQPGTNEEVSSGNADEAKVPEGIDPGLIPWLVIFAIIMIISIIFNIFFFTQKREKNTINPSGTTRQKHKQKQTRIQQVMKQKTTMIKGYNGQKNKRIDR